jgi:glycosyltransferase involved in cell wall biosynthesis
MNLAYTMAPGRGDTDLILHKLARNLAARGLRCSGTVQINSKRPDSGPCDMDVQVLPDGPVLRISQDLGPSARGCRLDPAALETAAGLVAASLDGGADVLIVNKFGKHEAEGRGFRAVIAEALALGIPVIVGVNGLNLPGFDEFAGGLASRLPPDCDALEAWVVGAAEPAIEAA